MTEAGLYGRVGKDAARTMLARYDRAVRALESGAGYCTPFNPKQEAR